MTDRLKRERELPAGYQFGDAAPELRFHRRAFELAMAPLNTEQVEDVIYGIGYFRDADVVPITIDKIDDHVWALCRCGVELNSREELAAHRCIGLDEQ